MPGAVARLGKPRVLAELYRDDAIRVIGEVAAVKVSTGSIAVLATTTGAIVPGVMITGMMITGVIVPGMMTTGMMITGIIVPGVMITGVIITGTVGIVVGEDTGAIAPLPRAIPPMTIGDETMLQIQAPTGVLIITPIDATQVTQTRYQEPGKRIGACMGGTGGGEEVRK